MSPPKYEVRISGVIPPELLAELHDLTISAQRPETVLSGSLPDQSAVVGLISRLHRLGLQVIEVRRLPANHSGDL